MTIAPVEPDLDPEVIAIIALISKLEAGLRLCVTVDCGELFQPEGPGNCVCPRCKSTLLEWRAAA